MNFKDLPETPMNEFGMTPRSAVKLVKNTKGVNWEIKLVAGEEGILKSLKEEAMIIHKELVSELDK